MIMLALVTVMALSSGAVAWADTVKGEGTITAHGTGVASLQGSGYIDISGHGVGTVWIAGADELNVEGEGYRHDFERGVLLVGWEGQIHAAGERLIVRMVGGLIDFTATGRGVVFLKGEGWYRLGDREGRWFPRGQELRLDPPPAPAE
jgi:hypothetical protein